MIPIPTPIAGGGENPADRTYSGLPDGHYQVTAYDGTGNKTVEDFHIDSVAPTVSISSPSNGAAWDTDTGAPAFNSLVLKGMAQDPGSTNPAAHGSASGPAQVRTGIGTGGSGRRT